MKDPKPKELPDPRSSHRLPWWIHILLAIGSYYMLKYVVPGLHLTNPTFQKLTQAAPTFAPLASILFLLLAAKRLYDIDRGEEESNQADGDDPDNPEEE